LMIAIGGRGPELVGIATRLTGIAHRSRERFGRIRWRKYVGFPNTKTMLVDKQAGICLP
jgi:hypothetical protein